MGHYPYELQPKLLEGGSYKGMEQGVTKGDTRSLDEAHIRASRQVYMFLRNVVS